MVEINLQIANTENPEALALILLSALRQWSAGDYYPRSKERGALEALEKAVEARKNVIYLETHLEKEF